LKLIFEKSSFVVIDQLNLGKQIPHE